MSDTNYHISNSTAVAEQLRSVFERAGIEGVVPVTIRAARWLVEEMERTPYEFGESREYFEHAEIHKRIVFVPPMYAFFGIHQESRTVFVMKVGWLERKPKA